MNPLNHVAIIMDGNGRWGLKHKNSRNEGHRAGLNTIENILQETINQVGSITTPEPRMINIQIWDANNVSLVDAAIKKSDLGLNPQIDGQLIRLPVPELNEERRIELKKLIKSIGEKCKVSIRNIRREANEELKKLLKSKEIGEDEEKSSEKNVQVITDDHIKTVDEKVSLKEKEIMTI